VSERGFFAIDRGVWEHPLFAREKFSEREAWFWLISSAAWEPIRIRVGRAWVDLARGQCAFALRFLAVRWMWSEPRVRRFLKRLTDDAAVLVSATRESTLITICKYNDYQLSRRADVGESDAPVDVKSTNPRRKEEETKQINKEQITKEDQQTRKRAARLPSDMEPSERNVSDASSLGMKPPEIDQQWRRMRDWSASSPKGACLDWDARWRNWCQTYLGDRNVNGISGNRIHQATGSAPTRDTAIVTGMARALERRRENRAATESCRNEFRGRPDPAGEHDAEPGSADGDDEPRRQLALLPARNSGA
jgi:Ni/Co efflux regulator RcnB